MRKLMVNSKTSKFFEDTDFKNKFDFCKNNPQMFMQLMQTDPRFMTVFQVITGIDLEKMQESEMKHRQQNDEFKKQKEEEENKKKAEEEEKKKKEAEQSLPPEEKEMLDKKKKAEKEKDLGNSFYKNKNFDEAISHYNNAIDLDPSELTYYTNKAAVYFEKGEYDTCIELCDKAEEIAKSGYYDFKKLGKAYARKANALSKQNKFDESIEYYKKAMLEHNDFAFKEAMKKVEKVKKQTEDQAYIDPEKSEEHREIGNKLFKEGDFPAAIKEYDEGLKRDPQNVKIYSNRAFAYIKLVEFPTALKDIEKGLEIDPNFVKLWVRKGNCHYMMKEYHKALEAYDKGLKIEHDNQELKEGKQKVMIAISQGASGGEDDKERMARAMADPEIQTLLKDFRVQSLLQEMQNDPMGAQAKLQDPFLADAINKLIAAGVLKVR
jgi:stress-induced-phosphoprotein 1